MEYRIIKVIAQHASKPNPGEQLEQAVNEAIRQGWQPLGGVAMHGAVEDGWPVAFLYQAMLRSQG